MNIESFLVAASSNLLFLAEGGSDVVGGVGLSPGIIIIMLILALIIIGVVAAPFYMNYRKQVRPQEKVRGQD